MQQKSFWILVAAISLFKIRKNLAEIQVSSEIEEQDGPNRIQEIRSNTPQRTQPPGSYSPFQFGTLCRPMGGFKTPKTEQEVQVIIKTAMATKMKVKAIGSKHSQSDVICTDGVAVDMSLFKNVQINADNSVTVGAGAKLTELLAYLHSKKRALQITPAYGDITIGGALGTGAHGTSLKHSTSLSDQTIWLKIVDGTGSIKIINGTDELKSYRVHLGLLGIILYVNMVTVPQYKVRIYNYETSDKILINGDWEPMVRKADMVTIYWFPSVGKVVISNGTFVRANTPGEAWSNANVPATSDSFNAVTVHGLEALQAVYSVEGMNVMERLFERSLTSLIADFPPVMTENGHNVKNPATGYPHRMTVAVCGKNCPWLHFPNNIAYLDNELSLDVSKMAVMTLSIKDILQKSPAAFPFQGLYMRFSKRSETYMSTTYQRDTIHLEWFPVKRRNQYDDPMTGITAYQLMMQVLALKHGGRSHWGKSGNYYHSRDMIQRKLVPVARQTFLRQMQIADPKQIFINNFGRRLLNITEKIDGDPNTKHCALLDNCVCKVNSDCARDQTCGSIPSYLEYKVCKNNDASIFGAAVKTLLMLPFNSMLSFFNKVLLVLSNKPF